MPALTQKQVEALRIANCDDLITTEQAHPAVLTSLCKRGYLRGEGYLGANRCYAPTDAAIEVMEQYDKTEKTVADFGRAVDRTLPKLRGVIVEPISETLKLFTPSELDPTPEEIEEADRLYEEWGDENSPSLPDVEPDDAPTEPINPSQPARFKTTFNLYGKLEPLSIKGVREWYTDVYRAQRLMTRIDQYTDDMAIDIIVSDIDLDDVPVDLLVFAHESLQARCTTNPEPFIVRTWYKRLLSAQQALSTIPLDDNAGFNNAVLDFKLLKARYMSLQEIWQSRAEEAQSQFKRLKYLWELRQAGVQV